MHRYFIATVVTLTVAITGFTAAPARADSDDVAKALAGIAALAIIGKVISDANKNDHVSHNYSYGHHNTYRHHNTHRHHHIKPRPAPHRVSRKTLPAQCIRHVEMRNGNTRKVFGSRCLSRNYRHAHRLPNQCARRIETHRGHRWVYGARCLRNNGYQVARR